MTALSLISHASTKVSAAPAITQPIVGAPSAYDFVVPWHQLTPGHTVSQPLNNLAPIAAMTLPNQFLNRVISGDSDRPNQMHDSLVGNFPTMLVGGDFGNDFWGYGAADTMIGGDGKDVYHYSSWSDSTKTNRDQIIHFDLTVDKIDLSGLLSAHGNQAYVLIQNLGKAPDGASNVHLIVSDNFQYPDAHTIDINIALTGTTADPAGYMKIHHDWLIT
jgi:hypothetical protein